MRLQYDSIHLFYCILLEDGFMSKNISLIFPLTKCHVALLLFIILFVLKAIFEPFVVTPPFFTAKIEILLAPEVLFWPVEGPPGCSKPGLNRGRKCQLLPEPSHQHLSSLPPPLPSPSFFWPHTHKSTHRCMLSHTT